LQEGSSPSLVANDQSLEPKHFTCDHNLVVVGYDRVINGGYWEKSIPRSFISSCCRGGSSTITFSFEGGAHKGMSLRVFPNLRRMHKY
jgi:hypothetical protein